MMTGADVVATARGWMGVRFAHQGATRIGCDCIGLVAGVAVDLGIPEGRAFLLAGEFKGYGREPDPQMLLRACGQFLNRIALAQAGLGDILLLKFAREPQHFAIVSSLAPLRIIHTYALARRVTENSVDAVWRERIVGAFRYRGL